MISFISEDSYEGQLDNPLSLNLYTYVQNNPLIYVDPSGCKEVQLRDIVTQAGGTVSWNGATGIATVTVDGKTATYNIKDSKVVNGRIIVDDSKFNSTFSSGKSSGYTSIVKNTIEGVADTAFGKTVIDNLSNTKTSITTLANFGPAFEMKTVSVRSGVKVMKGASKLAGPVALGTYGYNVYTDYNKYDDNRGIAIGFRTVGTVVTVGAGAGAAALGAPVAVTIVGGAAVGYGIDQGVEYLQQRYCD